MHIQASLPQKLVACAALHTSVNKNANYQWVNLDTWSLQLAQLRHPVANEISSWIGLRTIYINFDGLRKL